MKLLTVTEVADTLSISKALVYSLVSRGELPYVQVGTSKGYRFEQRDIEGFIQARKHRNEGEKSQSTPRSRLRHIKL